MTEEQLLNRLKGARSVHAIADDVLQEAFETIQSSRKRIPNWCTQGEGEEFRMRQRSYDLAVDILDLRDVLIKRLLEELNEQEGVKS